MAIDRGDLLLMVSLLCFRDTAAADQVAQTASRIQRGAPSGPLRERRGDEAIAIERRKLRNSKE